MFLFLKKNLALGFWTKSDSKWSFITNWGIEVFWFFAWNYSSVKAETWVNFDKMALLRACVSEQYAKEDDKM